MSPRAPANTWPPIHAPAVCRHTRPLAPRRFQTRKVDDGPRVPPWVVYFFIFIVIGGAVFQILQSAMNGSPLSE